MIHIDSINWSKNNESNQNFNSLVQVYMLLKHAPLEYARGDYKYSRSKATSMYSSGDITAREGYYIRTITKNSFESLVLCA